MTRLIDADALLEAFKKQGYVPAIVEDLITNAPTIEADSVELFAYTDGNGDFMYKKNHDDFNRLGLKHKCHIPLYTSPPKREWKTLSSEHKKELLAKFFNRDQTFESLVDETQAKLKELNHG